MTLNVSCPNCGKKFERIKPSLIGKKAQCVCGQIIRLGKKQKRVSKSSLPDSRTPSQKNDDLMQVDLLGDDLLGDELLGDQLLGGDLEDPAVVIPDPIPDPKPHPKPHPKPDPKPPKTVQEIQKSVRKPVQKKERTKAQVVTPVVQVDTVSRKKKRRSRNAQKPVFEETYNDLDAILNGAGDAAPIAPRAQRPSRKESSHSSSVNEHDKIEASNGKGSSVGLIAAILSSVLAFWFGVFAIVPRFGVVDQPLIGGFTSTLHSIYHAEFGGHGVEALSTGDYEVSESLQALMIGIGWLFWVVAILLMLFGAAQFLNAIYKMVSGQSFFRWCDGLTGATAVAALFVVVGLLFTQTTCHKAQQKFLDDYEAPVVAEGEHLETVEALRAELKKDQNAARNWLFVGAAVPLSIFVFSSVRLFTND